MSEQYDITLSGGLKGAKPKKFARKGKNREGSWFYLSLAGQIGYTIAIPLVLGVLAGYWYDSSYGTKPVGTLVGLGIGSVLSGIGFVRTIKNLLQE